MTQHAPSQALDERELLLKLFQAAVTAVDPLQVVGPALPARPQQGRVIVLGAGKAAARMALAVEQAWPVQAPGAEVSGLVVTRYGHGEATSRIQVLQAGHPHSDSASADAALQMLALAGSAQAEDLVIALISGGGSALLSLPAEGVNAADKRQVCAQLLKSGAPISEINCVRSQLSAIKGGKLAEACGAARLLTLVISDVPGDDPAVVASGPTLPSHSTPALALEVLQRHRIEMPDSVRLHLLRSQDLSPAQVKPVAGPREVKVLATAQMSLEAAAAVARQHGLLPLILGGSLEGESRDVAAVHAGIARQIRQFQQPVAAPCVILSGGETTVTVRGNGRGGRNAEFLLALALSGADVPELHALACDTDGIDGVEDNAGALLSPASLARAADLGLSAADHLQRNDAYHFFKALDDLVVTGPTRTNVNDFRAILLR
ncbi:glycerate kinase type-2 family protein [Paucibacter sp. KCTC 42545]|uniref:glycerate kinase type-2 family protein n=1 Tax=Paucibacter sp. KCTC 42545 TaxID=1768242 RepID=UPI000733AE09|nr:glycerate kinase [Paucibacter sp. KCTC 42545]ALT77108.1 hydroxypyruvate reductase [Paucibacter sp. KCTC 42545]